MVVRIIAVDGKKEYQLSHVRIPAIAETTIKNTRVKIVGKQVAKVE